MKQILGSRHQIHTDRKRWIRIDDRYNRRERQNNSRYTFGTEEQIEELYRMHRQSDKIQGSRYKGTNDKDRQWATIQIKSDRSIHFFFYQEIRPHGSLGYKTPNKYEEYSRGTGCEKGAINRVVVVKK